MSLLDRIFSGVLLGGLAWLACGGPSHAQTYTDPTATSNRAEWEQRAIQRPAYRTATRPSAAGMDYTYNASQPRANWAPTRKVSSQAEVVPAGTPEGVVPGNAPVQGNIQYEPGPGDVQFSGGGNVVAGPEMGGPGCGGPGCGGCCPGGGETWCEDECGDCFSGYRSAMRNFSVFGGVHGFKNLMDQGRQGNFGFHEGFNWGGPLGGMLLGDGWRDVGYQIGLQGLQSNLYGDHAQATGAVRDSDHNQIFVTGGLFRRAPCGGFQWGVVFDALHDRYYQQADLRQVRADVGFVDACCGEIGFWGAFTVGNAKIPATGNTVVEIRSTNLYTLYYRKYFSGGGDGRFWAGLTEDADGIIGGDLRVPLGSSWALENGFSFLIPQKTNVVDAQARESWSVSMHLVWYPGRSSLCQLQSPFRPMQSVADNSVFSVRPRDGLGSPIQ